MMRPRAHLLTILGVLLLWGAGAHLLPAHELRPAYLELRELTQDRYQVLWKVPARGEDARLRLQVQFAEDVEPQGESVGYYLANAHIQKQIVRREGGLMGTPITILGLDATYTDVLLRLEWLDGSELTRRLTADAPTYVIEAAPHWLQVGWTYLVIGVEHIWFGVDHLLFVLALLLIVRDVRKLVETITAFTLAHSVTLAVAAFGWVHVPGPPVEAIIALSIVFVAVEIVHDRQGRPGITARAPWLVSFSFGLLHGFGFAGALQDVGLPSQSIPWALFMFNVGVEVGQLLFVAVILLARRVLDRVPGPWPEWTYRVPAYAIGGLAAFWFIERTVGFWNA